MIVNESNGRIINSKNIYFHDDIFDQMTFNREQRILAVSLIKENSIKDRYEIVFSNVVGFEMTNCDFWGPSPHVLDFEYVEADERALLSKLKSKMEKNPFEPSCKIVQDTDFIETVFTFTSGDTLTIVCESIILNCIEIV